MRSRTLLTAALAVAALVLPGQALAKTITASSNGVTATVSYLSGPGVTTKNLRLKISQGGVVKYNSTVKSKFCFHSCSVASNKPLKVVDLYGDGGREVVLTLFTNGADCCTIAQVFAPSASIGSYELQAQRNFGAAAFVVRKLHGKRDFVSADNSFYCRFSACYASALPFEAFAFTAGRFQRIHGGPATLVKTDANRWWKDYVHATSNRESLIAAWAADEWNLHRKPHATKVLHSQVANGHITAKFVSHLVRFLRQHGY